MSHDGPRTGPSETLFAGAAPGMIGVYQVTFRMPADVGAGPVTGGGCTYSYASGGGTMSWVHFGRP